MIVVTSFVARTVIERYVCGVFFKDGMSAGQERCRAVLLLPTVVQ
jgi:hypothetical protein